MGRQLSVLLLSAPDVPGEWISHCLDWDIVSQGRSPQHAMAMLCEAIMLSIQEDISDDMSDQPRPKAPDELWKQFAAVRKRGTQLSAAALEKLSAHPQSHKGVVCAAEIQLDFEVRHVEKPSGPHVGNVGLIPPPFLCALENEREPNHRR